MSIQDSQSELEEALLRDKSFQHILKFAPQSQRELMTFEIARYFDAYVTTRVKEAERLARIQERSSVDYELEVLQDLIEEDIAFTDEFKHGVRVARREVEENTKELNALTTTTNGKEE